MGGRGQKGKLPEYEYDKEDGLITNWSIDWPEGQHLVRMWDSRLCEGKSVKWLREVHKDIYGKFKYSAVARGWNTLKSRDKSRAERDNPSQPTVCKSCDNFLFRFSCLMISSLFHL